MLSTIASDNGCSFEVVNFSNMSFSDQYAEMRRDVRLAIGIHGANIVNAMFLRPGAALVELFPYGFDHDMYKRGGNAGVRYEGYSMSTSTVEPFKDIRKFKSILECTRRVNECKAHYRDAKLNATRKDLDVIERLVRRQLALGSERT